MLFLSLLLQCKFANSTLLSLLSFSFFITPYDVQASSAFSALIYIEIASQSLYCLLAISQKLISQSTVLYRIQCGQSSYFSLHFNSCYLKQLIPQSKFSGTRKFTLRYQ